MRREASYEEGTKEKWRKLPKAAFSGQRAVTDEMVRDTAKPPILMNENSQSSLDFWKSRNTVTESQVMDSIKNSGLVTTGKSNNQAQGEGPTHGGAIQILNKKPYFANRLSGNRIGLGCITKKTWPNTNPSPFLMGNVRMGCLVGKMIPGPNLMTGPGVWEQRTVLGLGKTDSGRDYTRAMSSGPFDRHTVEAKHAKNRSLKSEISFRRQ